MTELFKARGKLVEQGKLLNTLLGSLSPPHQALASQAQTLRYEAFVHIYEAALENGEKWALKLQGDLSPIPAPVPTPDPTPIPGPILQYALAYPFKPNGEYGWLKRLTDSDLAGAELGVGGRSRWITSNNSASVSNVPATESDIKVVYNSELKDGERGVLWHNRAYNVVGYYHNATIYRAGDAHKGKEGHGWYNNVYGDVSWNDCHAIQCGGNPWQLVHRDKETKLVGAQFDEIRAASEIALVDCSATDSGYIDEPDETAARGSWPLSFFNPGHSLYTQNFRVETEIDPFNWSGGIGRSHGAVLHGIGQNFRTCPSATHIEPYVDVVDSDRELFHVDAVDDFRLEGATMKNTSGVPDVMITTRCKKAVVYKPKTDLKVVVKDGPFGDVVKSIVVKAGQVWAL